MKSHVEIHNRNFINVCTFCEKEFGTRNGPQLHFYTIHKNLGNSTAPPGLKEKVQSTEIYWLVWYWLVSLRCSDIVTLNFRKFGYHFDFEGGHCVQKQTRSLIQAQWTVICYLCLWGVSNQQMVSFASLSLFPRPVHLTASQLAIHHHHHRRLLPSPHLQRRLLLPPPHLMRFRSWSNLGRQFLWRRQRLQTVVGMLSQTLYITGSQIFG